MNDVFSFEQPEESDGFLLWQLTMLWQRKMKRALDPYGITHTQFVILAALGWLSKDEAAVTQMDVAHHSRVDRMMTSKILKTLENKGWVYRKASISDSRANNLSLTDTGQETLKGVLTVVEEIDAQFFLSVTQKDHSFHENMLLLVEKNSGTIG